MRQLKISKSITNRETASIDKYLHDISKQDLITAEEEVKLAIRIREGDNLALEKLACANLRFVVSVAKQYQNQGLSLPDLINEGNLGLLKAAKRFDETRGFKFISYAVWWIRQSIINAIAEQSRVVRLPLNQVGALHKVNKQIRELEQSLERNPSVEEIAESLDLPIEKVKLSLKQIKQPLCMDAPIAEGENTTIIDIFDNKNQEKTDTLLINESLSKEIQRVLSTLDKKEKEILTLFYGLGMKNSLTLEEIAQKFGLTRERVRQLKERAIRNLQHKSRSKLLVSYLG